LISNIVEAEIPGMDVDLIEDSAAAVVALDPVRARGAGAALAAHPMPTVKKKEEAPCPY